jgi:hypothetical protein
MSGFLSWATSPITVAPAANESLDRVDHTRPSNLQRLAAATADLDVWLIRRLSWLISSHGAAWPALVRLIQVRARLP